MREKMAANRYLYMKTLACKWSCADPESFVRGGPTQFSLVDEGRERIIIPLKVHAPANEI